MKQPKEKLYTLPELIGAVDAEKTKFHSILNYLINKNSHPLPRGMDYHKLLDDMQDFEEYLRD